MDAETLVRAGMKIAGRSTGWHEVLGKLIGVKPSRIKEWILANRVPDYEAEIIMGHYSAALEAEMPQEEWHVSFDLSDDLCKRTRISHLEHPRFTARVVECDESGDPVPEEDLADLETGRIFRGHDGVAICEVMWDDPVDPSEQMEWLKRAHELSTVIDTDGSSDH